MAHIWVPKLKIVEAQIRAPRAAACGYLMIEACNRYGQVKRRLGPWKQVITDACMDMIFYFKNDGLGGAHQFCAVGTGSPTFTTGSTGLANPIAMTSSTLGFSNTIDTTGADGYRERHTITKEFALGAISANLTEVGFFTGNNNTSGCFLDLIRDNQGNPTTFPVTSEDQLRVTHILDRYPYLGTVSGSFVIGGSSGSGTHDYELNMKSLGSSSAAGSDWAGTLGCANNNLGTWNCSLLRDCTALGSVTDNAPTNAVLLAVNTSGSSSRGTSSNDGTTWYRTKTFTWGLTAANHPNGISGLVFGSTDSDRAYKAIIDPPIPKFAGSIERILTLECSIGITRGP